MSKILIVAEHLNGKLNSATSRCVTCATAIGGEDHDVDGVGIQGLRGGDALGRGGVELAAEVFGDDEDPGGHQSSPFAFSAATSSAASFTITPLLRLAGGA